MGEKSKGVGQALQLLGLHAALAIILLAVAAQFLYFSSAYPLVGSVDEIAEVLDGIAIKYYLQDSLSTLQLAHPIAYFEEFQSHAFGLALKSRPPYFRLLEGAAFLVLPPTIESARLLVLLHALAFFTAFYLIVDRHYGKRVAVACCLLLLASLSFMQYSWRVYLEFSYLLFALLSAHFFAEYLKSKSNRNLLCLFLCLLFGLLSKEVFVAIFAVFLLMLLFEWRKNPARKNAVDTLGQLLQNRLFLPCAALVAVICLPWYAIKASTPLFAHLAAGQPFTASSLLTYPLMLLQQEPVLTAGFLLFLATALFAKKRAAWQSADWMFLSLFAGFFILVSAASNKELRYLFFLYPVFALFTARLLDGFWQSRQAFALALAALLAVQLLLSYAGTAHISQLSYADWQAAAAYLKSLPSARSLYAANPSLTALSYYLVKDRHWKESYIVRLHPTTFAPVEKQYPDINENSTEFFYAMMDYYRLDHVVADTSLNETAIQRSVLREIEGNGAFKLLWKQNQIAVYSYQKNSNRT